MLASLKAGSVVVHFGMPKTGTTSIQRSLSKRLSDARFHYIDLGSNPNHAIATAFKGEPSRYRRHAKLGTPPEQLPHLRDMALRKLRAELETAATRTGILSAEIICTMRAQDIRGLNAELAARGSPVMAVGYVRRPKEAMESVFQQQVKGGRRQTFDTNQLFPKYRGRLRKMDEVFGRENTQAWLFDPARFPGNCVVQDFCARLGIAFDPGAVVRANDALSRPALSLLYAYRKLGPGYGTGPDVIRENKLLIRRLRALPGPKLRLHSGLVVPVIDSRREDIAWTEERIGVSLAEDLGAHDQHAVRSEDDLLAFTPESLSWLAKELGPEFAPKWRPDMSPGQVAEWMHLLRIRVSRADPAPAKPASARSPA
jgi:hypothetical protein